MTRIGRILSILYVSTVVLFLIDGLTTFDIKNQALKTFVYYGLLIQTPLVLLWNAVSAKTRDQKIIESLLPVGVLVGVVIVGPTTIVASSGAWHTQTILFVNQHSSFRTVEYQMQDAGAMGFNTRTVEVSYLTPWFTISSDVPNDIETNKNWVKVTKDVNELKLKYP